MIVPEVAVHLTLLSAAVPCTVAANWNVPLMVTWAIVGEMATELTTGLTVAVVTVTLPVEDLVRSATLVAVTMSFPALAGAV